MKIYEIGIKGEDCFSIVSTRFAPSKEKARDRCIHHLTHGGSKRDLRIIEHKVLNHPGEKVLCSALNGMNYADRSTALEVEDLQL